MSVSWEALMAGDTPWENLDIPSLETADLVVSVNLDDLFSDAEEDVSLPVSTTTEATVSRLLQALLVRSAGSGFSVRPRLQWEPHLTALIQESRGSFDRLYRMCVHDFMRLRDMLHPFLQRSDRMARVRCGVPAIDSTVVLHCLLRWLAGGNYLDIRIVAGISVASFYRLLHAGMEAVLACDELSFHLPATAHEIACATSAFRSLSTHDVVRGCVGALDGWLCPIVTPATFETGHVRKPPVCQRRSSPSTLAEVL
eukprot:GHVU01164833.1.p1 GENE.GHVU01164833.1~~GHVU01164833.1.p1  ORF type:complete len:255 (-),score=12.36 GHVU01164833.1:284-1048(-)